MKTRAKRFVSALLAGVLCLSLLAGCASKKKELTRYSTVFYDVFDTVTQVIAYCESEEEFNTQMDALHADLITYNQLYDIYNDYPGVTNVKTINDNAGSAPVEVDDRILSMLELADQMYQTTNGKLNIAMGSVLISGTITAKLPKPPRRMPTTSCPPWKSWKQPPSTVISTT